MEKKTNEGRKTSDGRVEREIRPVCIFGKAQSVPEGAHENRDGVRDGAAKLGQIRSLFLGSKTTVHHHLIHH